MVVNSKSVRRAERSAAARTKGTATAKDISLKSSADTVPVDEKEPKTYQHVLKKHEGGPLEIAMKSFRDEAHQLRETIDLLQEAGDQERVPVLKRRLIELSLELTDLQKHKSQQDRDHAAVREVLNKGNSVSLTETPNPKRPRSSSTTTTSIPIGTPSSLSHHDSDSFVLPSSSSSAVRPRSHSQSPVVHISGDWATQVHERLKHSKMPQELFQHGFPLTNEEEEESDDDTESDEDEDL